MGNGGKDENGGGGRGRGNDRWEVKSGTKSQGVSTVKMRQRMRSHVLLLQVTWLHDILKIVHAILVVIAAIAGAVLCRRSVAPSSILLRLRWLDALVVGIAGG